MDNIEDLTKKYLKLKEENENTKQELHECKRNLKIMHSTQQDYKNEVDMLQSEEIKQKQKYQEIIRQLEQNINDVRSKHSEEIQSLEDTIVKMEEKIDKLKSELYVFKDANITHFRGDTSSLIQEILSEPPEFYENQELRVKLQEVTDANKALEEKVQEYGRELENLQESYEDKKSLLNEANENNVFLVDENAILKSELDILKSKPLNEDSKGNSLFAEVNDRRVYLQDQINKMKPTFVAMAQEKAQLQNIVHHLKIENLRLLDKWSADIDEIDDDAAEIQSSLRSRNNVLEKLNEQYVRELAEKQWIVSKIGAQEIEFFEKMLNDKKTEIKFLREEVLNKTLAQMSFAKELTEARMEKRKWRLEAMIKQYELELLQRTEQTYSSNKNKEKTDMDIEDVDQNYIYKRDSKMPKERLSDVKEEEQYDIENLDCQSEALNATVDNYLKRNTGLENPKVSNISKAKDSMLVRKESNYINVDKENMSDQSRKVTFANDTISPKVTARRNYSVISRPSVEL